MNTLSRQKRAIFFYSSLVIWVMVNVALFFYLLSNFWILKSQIFYLFILSYIPLLGALYFSLDLDKNRKLLFFVFLITFFTANALALFGILRGMLGLVGRNAVPGLALAYLFVWKNVFQLVLIATFFIYERAAKNAKRFSKIFVPVTITISVYLIQRLAVWIWFTTNFKG